MALRARQRQEAELDDVGKNGDEGCSEQRAQERAHPANDDHREVLDGEEEGEGLHGYEAAVIREQRAGESRDRRADHEGEKLVAGDADAESLGDRLLRPNGAPSPTSARTQQVYADEKR